MSKWKPIEELPASHVGYAWLRHKDRVSLGWRGPSGHLSHCDAEVSLGDSPTHFIFCDQTRPTAPKKARKSKWISLDEKLPPNGYCLVTIKGMENMLFAFYDEPNQRFTMEAMRHVKGITHWRKLPKSMEEEKKENE